MVWSEQIGVSITVPSDRVDGDGRNYITIGEDIPDEIAGFFSAAIVFRNGNPNVGAHGLNYWAFGITTAGSLALVALAYDVVGPDSDKSFAVMWSANVSSVSGDAYIGLGYPSFAGSPDPAFPDRVVDFKAVNALVIGAQSTAPGAVARRDWVESQIAALLEVEVGNVVVNTTTAGVTASQRVNFASPFTSTPVIQATAQSGVPGTVMLGCSINNPGPTGFDAVVHRTNVSVTTVHWTAHGTK